MALNESISCPSCGVSISDTTAHTRSMSCPHCSNWVYLGSNGWESAGLFEHAIDAPSILRLGKRGVLEDRPFVVVGRVRMSYSEGFWDEWWLEFDDGFYQWLEEDDGVYRLHSPRDHAIQPGQFDAAIVGGNVSIEGADWFVTERVDAQVAGVEGSLPVAIVPGESVVCVDGINNGIKASFEAADMEVQMFQGRVVRGQQFQWD